MTASATDTPTENPKLTAMDIGKRFLKLIEGLESRNDLSPERIKDETGISLGHFPVPSENLDYYAYSQPLDDGWFFSINYSPASLGLKEGAELTFSNAQNGLASMQAVCALDFDYYHSALKAMGYRDTPIRGEIGEIRSWRYYKNDITISIIPQNVVAGESGRLCVKSIGTLN